MRVGTATSITDFGDYYIFTGIESEGLNNTSIEDSSSNFNQHRLSVIRHTVEKNLSVAIANYNNFSGVSANFQMPKLQETDWDLLLNNITMISFLQGLSIGGKVYNGYSIVPNTKNEELVSEDSIYIADNNQYYKVTDKNILNAIRKRY